MDPDYEGYTYETEEVRAANLEPIRWATRGLPFEEACDAAYREETARDEAAKAETSPEQREYEGHDALCEAEFIHGPMAWTPCRCAERAEEIG